jgi:Protein of unknown function (DUF4058)
MDALNGGILPNGVYAYVEAKVAGYEPNVVTIQSRTKRDNPASGGVVTLDPPRTKMVARIETDRQSYARRANRISVRHAHGEVVAIVELVSPGNKDTEDSLKSLVNKVVAFLRRGVHLAVVDLFPPTKRDPQGVHKAIVDQFDPTDYDPPPGKDRVLVGYCATWPMTAYIEPVGVGDVLAPVPLYVAPDEYVQLPLEATYMATWAMTPKPIRELLESAP